MGTARAVEGLPLVVGAARLLDRAPTTVGTAGLCEGVAERGTGMSVPERDRELEPEPPAVLGLAWALRAL